MKNLNKYVNIIPVIAKVKNRLIKGDKLTIEEIKRCKIEILNNFKRFKIRLFDVSKAIKVLLKSTRNYVIIKSFLTSFSTLN